MISFTRSVVRLARNLRASEQDALFARNRIAIDDYTDSELSQELLHKKNSVTKNINSQYWKMVAFIYDKFTQPSSKTHDKKYTEYEYNRDINYHHIIDGVNLNFSSKVCFFQKKMQFVLDFFRNIDILYINTIYLHRKDKKSWRIS